MGSGCCVVHVRTPNTQITQFLHVRGTCGIAGGQVCLGGLQYSLYRGPPLSAVGVLGCPGKHHAPWVAEMGAELLQVS